MMRMSAISSAFYQSAPSLYLPDLAKTARDWWYQAFLQTNWILDDAKVVSSVSP